MIVLIGFKHVGKSSCGKLISEHFGLDFYDLDDLIEDRCGMSPRECFNEHGETEFRKIERECLESILEKDGLLAVGGGTPLHNEVLLSEHLCIHITADKDQVFEWIKESGPTPLFSSRAAFDALWDKRLPVYERLSHFGFELNHCQATFMENQFNAVIGWPLEHSQSPELHNRVYQDLGLNALLHKVAHPDISMLIEVIRSLKIGLTAVTMPHKESILEHLDEVDSEAKAIGAVNTVINREGKLTGFNTDIVGIEFALRDIELEGKKVVLIGAGGAARPVAHFIHKKKGSLFYINRTEEKALKLKEVYGGEIISPDEIPADTTLIVNATPLGLYPEADHTPLDESFIPPGAHGFDLVYNPRETRFLKSFSGKRISGYEMFIAQGLKQIELWTGKTLSPKDYLTQ